MLLRARRSRRNHTSAIVELMEPRLLLTTLTVPADEVPTASFVPGYQDEVGLVALQIDPGFAGIDGSGETIVIIDSGFDLSNPMFAGRVLYSFDFSGNNDLDASPDTAIDRYHGTAVAHVAAGSLGTYSGIATGANLVLLKAGHDQIVNNEVRTVFESTDVLESLAWVIANVSTYNIAAVNLSIGNSLTVTQFTPSVYANRFNELADLGVVSVVASGNDFQITGPSVSPTSADLSTLSIGSVDFNNQASYFSDRTANVTDLFARGEFVPAYNYETNQIVGVTGTSFAAPQVAGAVALLQQLAEQELGRRLELHEIREHLRVTGDVLYDAATDSFYRRLNIHEAARRILATQYDDVLGYQTANGLSSYLTTGFSNGSSFAFNQSVPLSPVGPYVLAYRDMVGDFDGDYQFEAIDTFDGPRIYELTGSGSQSVTHTGSFQEYSSSYTLTADINGDRFDDLIIFKNDQTSFQVALSHGNTLELLPPQSNFGMATEIFVGDFNRDTLVDLAFRRPSTTPGDTRDEIVVRFSEGTTLSAEHIAARWNSASGFSDTQVGDFNGDGFTDLAARTTNNSATTYWWGTIFNQNGDGNAKTPYLGSWAVTSNWTNIGVGDFDNDGRSDIVGQQIALGKWWVKFSHSSFTPGIVDQTITTEQLYMGRWNTDIQTWSAAMFGDFDGDGKDEITGMAYREGFLPTMWVTKSYAFGTSNYVNLNFGTYSQAVIWFKSPESPFGIFEF